MLLAELPPPNSYQAIGWIFLGLGALAAAAIGIRTWIRAESGIVTPQPRTIEGQPLRVSAEPRWVPEADFRRHVEDVDRRFRELDRRIGEIHADIGSIREHIHQTELALVRSGEERASKLHERINLILERVSELRAVESARRRGDATPI